jgi:hypothetical protein
MRTIVALALPFVVSFAFSLATSAAVITVDTLANGPGDCSLAEAIAAANTDAVVDGCAAGSGDDEIDLNGLSGTLPIPEPGIHASENVAIRGPGARVLRLSGSALAAGTQMIRNDDATLEISDVTIADKQGGGIFASCLIPCNGQMVLDRVRVTNCDAVPTTFPFDEDGIGGAVSTNCTDADLTIRNSLFDANTVTGPASQGGAIWWAGRDLTIVNTTFSGNTSEGVGGALWVLPFAGGGGEAVLRNVTLHGNSAGSGAAIFAAGSVTTIQNSALAASASGGNCAGGGTLTSLGFNLSDDATCPLGGNDHPDTPSGLGTLGDHGGPTDTVLYLPGSPLEDAGDPAGCADPAGGTLTADQRGAVRPLGAACDIGAVEALDGCGVPITSCRTAAKSKLRIANGPDPAKRQLTWSWKKGDAVDLSDLGDPSTDTSYSLCVYDGVDGTPALALPLLVDPGAAWKATGTKGWKYKDKTGASDGVQSVALKVGAAGKASAQLTARGQSLPDLAPNDGSELFDEDESVVVQLFNGGACWGSEFTPAGTKRNEADAFEAKAP